MDNWKNWRTRFGLTGGRHYHWEQALGRAASFAEALDFPRCQTGFAAAAEAGELADRIEGEWYEDYRLFAQGCYAAEHILPEDLYVFNEAMTWLVIFTHETTDWESEWTDPMKAAESRYCILVEA